MKKAVVLDEEKNEIPQPNFIKYEAISDIFSVEGVKDSNLGSYYIGLRLGYVEYPES